MTVILCNAFEALPGKAAPFAQTFGRGTAIAEKIGARVHRLQGYIGAPPTVLAAVLEFENFTALSEYTITRDEDQEWREFTQYVAAAPVAQLVNSFDAVEVHGLETNEKIKSGAIHATMLQPIPEKLPTLIQQLSEIKEAHEKEGAQVHVFRHTTGETNGQIDYSVKFDNVIELGKFADKLERNSQYHDLLAKVNADAACAVLASASYKALTQ